MALYPPFHQLKCPNCFKQFHPGDCPIFFLNQQQGAPPRPPKMPPQGGISWLFSRFWVKRLVGRDFVLMDATRYCPNCKRALPSNIELADNVIIALVGNSASGKTHFMASAIQELMNPVVRQALGNVQVRAQSLAIEQKYRRDYFDILYALKQPPPPNPPGQPYEPLIYVLSFPQTSQRSRPVNLIFYDIAGEDIYNPRGQINYGEYIFHADAMIVLTDPLTIEEIADQILPQYRLTPQQLALVQGDVLTWVVPNYQAYHGTNLIPIPTAITISKSDLLEYIHRPTPYAFFMPPSYKETQVRRIFRSEFDLINADVEELLNNYGGVGQVQWKSQFSNVRFFAVSATGWPMDPATRQYPGKIQPIRVLDPLLWILQELKIIEVK